MKIGTSIQALLFASAALATSGGALAQTVTASWYSAKAANHVASNTYPKGTRLHLVNVENGRSAEGIVAGTGPFVRGRQLDVSHQLAAHLGFVVQGTAPIAITPEGK